MRILCLLSLLLVSNGCSTHQPRCDGRLQPINATATVQRTTARAPISSQDGKP